jgi:hypothetical protein
VADVSPADGASTRPATSVRHSSVNQSLIFRLTCRKAPDPPSASSAAPPSPAASTGGRPGHEVVGHEAPLRAGPDDVAQPVEDLAPVVAALGGRASLRLGCPLPAAGPGRRAEANPGGVPYVAFAVLALTAALPALVLP